MPLTLTARGRSLLSPPRTGRIGIDLGARAIKMVQLERVAGGVRIAAFRIVAFPEPLPFTDPESVGRRVTEAVAPAAMRRAGFAGRTVSCVVSMSATPLRLLELPAASEAETREMIAQELMADESTGDEEFDFWAARKGEEEGVAGVHVLSAPRGLMYAIPESLRKAGLDVREIDGLPFALWRAVRLSTGDGPAGPVAALDLGYASATLVIANSEGPVFVRGLRGCGLGDWYRIVADRLALSEEEAAELLSGDLSATVAADAGSELDRLVREVTEEPTSRLLSELDRTLAYLRLKHPDLAPVELRLFGGGASVAGLEAAAGERLGIPVCRWDLRRRDGVGTAVPAELLGVAAGASALAWS
jgi:Tfp pilus assembly PilM family ATPase